MLKRFEVENFKGFKNPLVMDFTAREYEFNKNLIVNGIVNKAIKKPYLFKFKDTVFLLVSALPYFIILS